MDGIASTTVRSMARLRSRYGLEAWAVRHAPWSDLCGEAAALTSPQLPQLPQLPQIPFVLPRRDCLFGTNSLSPRTLALVRNGARDMDLETYGKRAPDRLSAHETHRNFP